MIGEQPIRFLLGTCFCVCAFFFVGCEDKDLYEPDNDPKYVGKDALELDFSTTRTVKMDFNYDVTDGFVSTFDIYEKNPYNTDGTFNENLVPVASGIHVAGKTVTRVLPAYVKDLYLHTNSLFIPRLSRGTIQNSGEVIFSQTDIPGKEEVTGRAASRSIGNKAIDKYLKVGADFYSKTEGKNYAYDLINPDTIMKIPDEVFTAISQTFEEQKKADPQFYADATVEIQSDNGGQGVRVYLSVIHGGGKYNNSLSYFTYKGDKAFKDFTPTERNKLKVINAFRYADVHTNTVKNTKTGLTPGKYIQLLYVDEDGNYTEIFPIGAKIGWVLHSNASNGVSPNINTGERWIYSTPEWNDADKHGRNRTIYFQTTDSEGTPFNCFGFEDQHNGDGDCNDVIFHVLTDPIDAVVPPPSIDTEDIEKEETKRGIIAFEDNWPEQGDYDLNDVVVKYVSTITYVQQVKKEQGTGTIIEYGPTNIKKVSDVFTMVHTGAQYDNFFSYKMDISPSLVKSIKKDGQNYDPDIDGSGFIVDICPNLHGVDLPKNYHVEIEFEYGKLSEDAFVTNAAPYNPFILPIGPEKVIKYQGAEVHLPNYKPTSRVNNKLFGFKDDRSDQKTLWYVSGKENKFPFAIHLANANDDFTIPTERVRIDNTYKKYTSWVESDMTKDLDWYLYPSN